MHVTDDDEFDSYDTGNTEEICKARAIYDYVAQQYDELTIAPGNVPTWHFQNCFIEKLDKISVSFNKSECYYLWYNTSVFITCFKHIIVDRNYTSPTFVKSFDVEPGVEVLL